MTETIKIILHPEYIYIAILNFGHCYLFVICDLVFGILRPISIKNVDFRLIKIE